MGKKKKDKQDSTADMLLELATLDEVDAEIPTAAERVAGIVPEWCELRLRIKREPDPKSNIDLRSALNLDIPLRRHDGELIIEVLHEVLHPGVASVAGDAMWDALDAVVERIMKRRQKGKDPHDADLGEAFGLATAIAIVNNPMQPEVEDVRWAATERWNIRHSRD